MGNYVSKKFGARTLSEEEVRLTLPTYDKILEQIEDMRNDEWDGGKSQNLQNQKINNISILGARGTGKTSILKTLIARLEKDNKRDSILGKNIILPMIVPENMSPNSNLMSMILGLFKGIVDKIEEKENSEDKDCWFSKENEVSGKYRELVRKFCFIQPDFKSVSIEQYTTENDYVKKSSEIYQADIGFMSCFNEFINILLKKDGQDEKQRLLFVFIDDMDLSTYRCVDAVKTLLAYISHPRIVTILAGDLGTFEEAMTLDFIRQEQTMRAGILESTFVVGNGKEDEYLERKKALTYEYLKKVMPVVYRHNLREWTLETRGNYLVKGNEGNDKSLVELLNDCFYNIKNPPIFQYFEKEETEGKNLPQMFHIFDHTARGLNAVYNILLDTYDIMQKGEENKKFPQIKILLETIVASNSLFNQYRKPIFDNIIKFGNSFEDTRIDCENFRSFIIKEFSDNKQNSDEAKSINSLNELPKNIKSTHMIKIFRFFVLLDFSIRILNKNEILNNEVYTELKKYNVTNLINNPAISESVVSSKEIVKFERKNEIILNANLTNKEAKLMANTILKFLSSMDFILTVNFFHFLSYKKFNFFEDGKEKDINWSWVYKLCISLYNMIKSISRLRIREKEEHEFNNQINKILADLTLNYKEEFRTLIEVVGGGNPVSQMLKVLLYEILNKPHGEKLFDLNGEEYRTILSNTFSDILGSKIFDNNFLKPLSEKEEEYKNLYYVAKNEEENKKMHDAAKNEEENKKVHDAAKNEEEKENMYDRLSIIFSIDKNNLWKDKFSEAVRKYVNTELEILIDRLKYEEKEMVDVSCIKEEWIKFKESYKGVSKTKAIQLEEYIYGIFANNGEYKVKLSEIESLLRQIRDLAYSNKALYGRAEAFAILKEIGNAKLDRLPEIKSEEKSSLSLERLYAFIHIYASYTLAENNDLYILSSTVSEFINGIYDGSIEGVNNQIDSYKKILEKDVGEETVSKFEELFS